MRGYDFDAVPMPEQQQTDAPAPVFVFELPWEAPPLTENQRHHWRKKATLVKHVRSSAYWLTVRVPYFARVRVELEWIVATRHRRDAENIVPTLKAICDGLVDAGIVDDDTPAFMDKRMPVITYDPVRGPRMVLTITDITKEPSE